MTVPAPGKIRIMVLGASLRAGSLNNRLARLAAGCAADRGAQVDLADMSEFDVPLYDFDTQEHDGIPAGAHAFRDRLLAAQGFVIASPEYNASMPGVLKNLIDWVSRFTPQPFKGRHGLLMSASPSMSGGNRGLWALRVPLEHLGAVLQPEMFSLAQAHEAFGPDGQIADPALGTRFAETIAAFLDLTEAATHYPCARSAWVEFLGERTSGETERVEVS
ncbi:MAG TPA: NAD(P)H-dependent oxidoreductase [Micromonosporaceae bacterium]|nr:NAD(P)H-dependent oxidoreductase [Micromonosporaceae bacterium]